jgi:hypothetical protein
MFDKYDHQVGPAGQDALGAGHGWCCGVDVQPCGTGMTSPLEPLPHPSHLISNQTPSTPRNPSNTTVNLEQS